MADIELTINGDSSGARTELSALGETIKKIDETTGVSTVAMAKGFAVAGAAVAAAAAVSIKAWADSERQQRQLQRAAGDATGRLLEQSEAMSKLYAVDDDVINQSYTLLTQWGGQAAASEQATKAILNFAAATGTDAVAATEMLIRNVESGGAGLAKMGIHFKATGSKGKDFEAAVAAINSKLGGAAAADANSLTGQARAASLAFEDLQKSLGGALGEIIEKSGVVPKLTAAVRELNRELFTPEVAKKAESKEFIAQQAHYWEEILAGHVKGYKDFEKGIEFTFEEAQAELAKWQAKLNPQNFNAAFEGKGGVAGITNKGMQDAKKADLQEHAELVSAHDGLYQHEVESAERTFTALEKKRFDLAKSSEDGRIAEEKAYVEHLDRMAKEEAKRTEQAAKESADRAAKKADEARKTGDQIGAAFVNALADQLSKLAEGGEFDAALFIGDILAAAVGIAGAVIGTAFGVPAVGSALGNLAAMGVRAGASAISRGGKKQTSNTYHDGGWVGGLPAYHDGGWINPNEQVAVLRRNERVLTPEEVHHMGGPGAVDNMARGGSRVTLNVTAIDAKSVADTFAGTGGDGLRQALRRGHGALPAFLGRGPR